MKQSELFAKTTREAPRDEMSRNAIWLTRAGYVHKEMAGVYSYLPLGLRVIKKIEQIVREQMNRLGGQEVLLSALHPKENWEKTSRWQTMTDLYKIEDESDRELALGATHEEIITPLVVSHINSYQDLPFSVYQFQTKFRHELRAKSGLLRGREFIMKDLYSFHQDQADLDNFYKLVGESYREIFKTVGIGEQTIYTLAGGGTFSPYSHEFQTLTPAGEDHVHICEKCRLAINDEIIAKYPTCPECGSAKRSVQTGIEVGNTFQLGDKFSVPFELNYRDETGKMKPVIMGCYGLGISRLMGAIVEVTADNQGLIWPIAVAPFRAHLLSLGSNKDTAVITQATNVYNRLTEAGIEVLWDDRAVTTGIKFTEADLLGLPYRLVVSSRTVEKNLVEVKRRTADEIKLIPLQNLCALIG
ncbi:MAG: aminoacyl--tRNA ligase-related protein [Candidatus Vogelbacteria bacterium]